MYTKVIRYPYTQTLEKPIKYQYSKFYGFKFIKYYKSFRFKIISLLKLKIRDSEDLDYAVPNYLKKLNFYSYNTMSLIRKLSSTSSTKNRLSILLLLQHRHFNRSKILKEEVYNWLRIFIKKFEVSKRVFSKYGPKMDNVGGNYKAIENYILLAVNIAIFYNRFGNLKFLNALLKLNDMLCSMQSKVIKKYIPLFYFSINTEVYEIKKLFNKRCLRL